MISIDLHGNPTAVFLRMLDTFRFRTANRRLGYRPGTQWISMLQVTVRPDLPHPELSVIRLVFLAASWPRNSVRRTEIGGRASIENIALNGVERRLVDDGNRRFRAACDLPAVKGIFGRHVGHAGRFDRVCSEYVRAASVGGP
jgi:hypothetical protein